LQLHILRPRSLSKNQVKPHKDLRRVPDAGISKTSGKHHVAMLSNDLSHYFQST
jgi:hypothetical protein